MNKRHMAAAKKMGDLLPSDGQSSGKNLRTALLLIAYLIVLVAAVVIGWRILSCCQ